MGTEFKQKITTTHITNAAVETLATHWYKGRDYAKPHRKYKDLPIVHNVNHSNPHYNAVQ